MNREHFSSRLGFIMITAACSIGLGNIWRFPYITGKYGGASFVLLYMVFLVILGLPIVVMEFAVGRASQRSTALSFNFGLCRCFYGNCSDRKHYYLCDGCNGMEPEEVGDNKFLADFTAFTAMYSRL